MVSQSFVKAFDRAKPHRGFSNYVVVNNDVAGGTSSDIDGGERK